MLKVSIGSGQGCAPRRSIFRWSCWMKLRRGKGSEGFRRHLSQAGPGDTALFYFSGHGARGRGAAVFQAGGWSPEGLDEGLVAFGGGCFEE